MQGKRGKPASGQTSRRRELQEDAALVGLAVGGDGEAFACLYRRYKRCVWELSYYLCQRNHHDAEEAMQETFLKAWRSLRRYRGAGSFKAWLLAICRNVCIDRVHRAPARPLALERCGAEQIADRASAGGQVEAIVLRATLAALPPDEREAWFVVDVLGCTSQEAARIVGARASSTVRSRVNRAREQILNALNDEPALLRSPAPAPAQVRASVPSSVSSDRGRPEVIRTSRRTWRRATESAQSPNVSLRVMLRQMHIVLASTARVRGGTWRHIEDVGVQLGARGHRVTVGLLPAARELQAAATSAGLVWRPLLRTLRMNADVWHLHLHDTFEATALAILALRRPLGAAIVTEHLPRTPGSDPDLAPDGERRRGADLARTAFKRAQLALTARTVVPSHGAARFMTRRYGLDPGDVVVAYNGVASFPAAVPPLAAPGLQVVTVGALIDQKGIDVLLAAAGRSRHPWAVTIVGAGPRRAELERMAAALAPGRARFAGWSDDPSSCMRESHVLCMPSRYESFGYAAVEAGACGRPVVGSRIDGLDEVVVPGRTGILVEPDDPDALAAALDGLWNEVDTLATLGRAAREHTHRLFTIERTVDALLSLYEDVRSLRDG